MTRSRDGLPLALLGAGGLLAVAALAALTSDLHAESATFCRSLLAGPSDPACAAFATGRWRVVVGCAVAAVVAVVAGLVVPGRDRPSVFEVPLRYRVLLLAPLAMLAGIVGDPNGTDRLGDGLLPVASALGVLVVVLCAGVGRRDQAWSHLLAAAAVGGPLLLAVDLALRAGSTAGTTRWAAGPPVSSYYGDGATSSALLAALVVAVVVLVPAVAADRAVRPAPDRRVSVALVVAGALVGVVVRAGVPGSGPAVWLPLLLVPVLVAALSWVVAARGAERPRTPTSGSGARPR